MKKRSHFSVCIKLMALVKPLTGYMVLAVVLGLLGHLCAAFLTIFGGYALLSVLDFAVPITYIAAFMCIGVFALLRGVFRYGEQSCNHFIAFKLLALIRDKIFSALRKLCPAKLEGRDKGDLITVITSDIELLEVFYAHTISPAVIAFFMSAIMSLFIGSYHWMLGVLALAAYIVVGVVIPLLISKLNKDSGMRFRERSGALGSFVLDSLRGLPETIQYRQGEPRLKEMADRTDALAEDEASMKKMAGRNTAVTQTVILLFDIAMIFMCGFLYQNATIGFEGVLIPVIALMSSFGPVIALANLGSTLQNTFAAGRRVLDILDESPAVEEVRHEPEVDFSGADADQITFSYGGETILSNVSVEIPKDKVIGIVGKSGSGKSTLLKLFMRFWDAQSGKISISDTSIDKVNTSNLRAMESFVAQETHLFHDSIENNIRIAELNATRTDIENACKKASIHDFILTLPKGYDTLVGELGNTLSGGERQRIGLARAFLHDAPLIFLDEPTSNLDSLNEAVILKSLGEERREKTVVLVSHRKSTMRIADTVYCVEHGRVS